MSGADSHWRVGFPGHDQCGECDFGGEGTGRWSWSVSKVPKGDLVAAADFFEGGAEFVGDLVGYHFLLVLRDEDQLAWSL